MPISDGAILFGQVLDSAFQSRPYAEDIISTLGIDLNMLRTNAPVDDEIPPNGVTGLEGHAFLGAVQLSWDQPDPTDAVRKSIIEVIPEGGEGFTVESANLAEAFVNGLEGGIPHDFTVMLVDEWNRESAWSEVLTITPISSSTQTLDLLYMQQQGYLQDLIPAINLAGPTAAEGIKATALAASLAQNLLPLIESDMEIWTESVWPPPEAHTGDGIDLVTADIAVGHTLSLVTHDGHKKLQHDRATPSTDFVYYAASWSENRLQSEANHYIAQATVTGDAGTVVSLAVEVSDDDMGNITSIANSTQVTLGGGTQVISVPFDGVADKPYYRLRLGLHTDGMTVYWYRFMVEDAKPTTNEPSPWNSGVIAAGSVSARSLTAISANIATGLFEEAAIQSAHISELTADKIISGTLQVGESIEVGGEIRAGGATMDGRGVYLTQQSVDPDAATAWPNVSSADWFSSPPDVGGLPTPHSGIGFFDDTNDPRRGILIHSRGVATGNKDGYISITSTSGSTDRTATHSAFVVVRAAKPGDSGTVAVGHRLVVTGEINLPNNSVNSDEIAGLDAAKITGGGAGHHVDPAFLPEVSALRGALSYGAIRNTPDLSKFVTDQALDKRGYQTAAGVRRIVKEMVKPTQLK